MVQEGRKNNANAPKDVESLPRGRDLSTGAWKMRAVIRAPRTPEKKSDAIKEQYMWLYIDSIMENDGMKEIFWPNL